MSHASRLAHEQRLLLMALGAGAPGSVTALLILWGGDYTAKVQWTLTVFIVTLWLGFAFAVRERTVMPLQTVANLLESLREGDYSIRAREPSREDALGEVLVEVNQLGELLRSQRFLRLDATTLLQQVIQEIDVAVFTFDEDDRLRLVNRAGERMMAQGADRLLGRSSRDLSLAERLAGDAAQTFECSFPGQTGRWQSRRSVFRESGRPTQLLVLTDLSKALRDEERQAWQRLIRVLGHELNNSLAPIKSTAATVASVLRRGRRHEGWEEDAQRGLVMIEERCESLNRFVVAYSQLARLPAPTLRPVAVGPLVHRVARLEPRTRVRVVAGPELTVEADPDQLEQLIINLVKNAVEAVGAEREAKGEAWEDGLVMAGDNGKVQAEEIGSSEGVGRPEEAEEGAGMAVDEGAVVEGAVVEGAVVEGAVVEGLVSRKGEAGEAGVSIRWRRVDMEAVIEVFDTGPGLASTQNLFVPFFTTKPGGSGIGLVLCRQIAEAHGGRLSLRNRVDVESGCVARLALPL